MEINASYSTLNVLATLSLRVRLAGYLWSIAVVTLIVMVSIPVTRWFLRSTTSEPIDPELDASGSAWDRYRSARQTAAWGPDWKWWKLVRPILLRISLGSAIVGTLLLVV